MQAFVPIDRENVEPVTVSFFVLICFQGKASVLHPNKRQKEIILYLFIIDIIYFIAYKFLGHFNFAFLFFFGHFNLAVQ